MPMPTPVELQLQQTKLQAIQTFAILRILETLIISIGPAWLQTSVRVELRTFIADLREKIEEELAELESFEE